MAVDAGGTLYVADTGNNRVWRIGAPDALLPYAPSAPLAIAAGASGLVVADTGADGVQRLDGAGAPLGSPWPSATGLAADVVATPGLTLSPDARADLVTAGAPGSAIDARLLGVLAAVLRGHTVTVSVVKTGHPQFTSGGQVSNHWHGRGLDIAAVDGTPVNPASAGANALARSLAELPLPIRPTEVGSPWPIGAPGFFTDASVQNNIHVAFDAPGSGRTHSAPAGVAAARDGSVFVSDTFNDRVRKFGPDGTLLWSAGGFEAPTGLAVDPAGNAYVADTGNHRVVKLSGAGALLGVWGGPGQLSGPAGVAVDGAGNLYVSDTGNNRVQIVAPSGALIGGLGDLSGPTGIAVDCRGNVYVADTGNNRIQKFGERGAPPPPCTSGAPGPTASNLFRFGKLTRRARKGIALLVVRVPGPGRLLLTGRGVKRVSKSVKRAGNVTLRVNATGKARKRLRSRGRVTLRLKLRFTPAGGLPRTRGRTVELVLKRR